MPCALVLRPPVELPVGDLRALSDEDRLWFRVWQQHHTDRIHAIRVWVAANLPTDLKQVYFTWTLPKEIREVDVAFLVGCSEPTLRKFMDEACRRINEEFPDHPRYLPEELRCFGRPAKTEDPSARNDGGRPDACRETPPPDDRPPAEPQT